MADKYPPSAQRAALLDFVDAAGCGSSALRRDEYGDWRVEGRYGHIYAVPGLLREGLRDRQGFLIFLSCASYEAASRAWAFAKEGMSFAVLIADGDDEGIFFLDRVPTGSEAAIILRRVGIRRRRTITDAERERLLTISGLQGVKYRRSVPRSLPTQPVDLVGKKLEPST
jgi:hypothetical protein